MEVFIIGSGNVAYHLALAFEANDIHVDGIYSRNPKNAETLAEKLYDTVIYDDTDFSDSQAQVFLLCVSDDAIEDLASTIVLPPNAIIVHVSGTKEMSVLKNAITPNIGVFYPLMTFSKQVNLDISVVPFCIEASNSSTQKVLSNLAQKISKKVYFCSGAERLTLHVAAVFACNFTNHLWALSKEIVEDLDFNILKPLILETCKKAMASSHPAEVQTGPALRKDHTTLNKHKDFLKADDDLLKVYQLLSESIQNWHK